MKMSVGNDSKHIHNIYKNDPTLFKSYINKHVTITAKDSSVHHGILYTVDPVSESVILLEANENDNFNAKVVIGHSIEKIQVSSKPDTNLPELFPVSQFALTETMLIERKEAIKKLMTQNRFPIEDNNGVLEIKGVLFIEPPYGFENCICSNPIIMNRMQSILSQVA